MKYGFVLFVLLGTAITAQTVTAELTSGKPIASAPRNARLQLTTSIVKERSCFAGHLALGLRLSFSNTGSEPVILDKRSVITRAFVGRSPSALAARKYDQAIRADQWGSYFLADPGNMSTLTVIQPGEAFDLETDQTRVSLDVVGAAHESKGLPVAGNYFLQIEVATWTYLPDPARYKKAWGDKGYLWSEGLTSEPMSFVVQKDRLVVKCS